MTMAMSFLRILEGYIDKGIIMTSRAVRKSDELMTFLNGMQELMKDSEECFVIMTIYFGRIISRHNVLISEVNMNRLIFMAGIIAIKVYDDFSLKNSHYARLSGVSMHEFNELERNFLILINYSLNISDQEYRYCLNRLINH